MNEHRKLAPKAKADLLRYVKAVPSNVRVYINQLTGVYEVWLRGAYVTCFDRLNSGKIRDLNYLFSNDNDNRNKEQEFKDGDEKQLANSERKMNDIVNECASDMDRYCNKNAVSVSVLPKR